MELICFKITKPSFKEKIIKVSFVLQGLGTHVQKKNATQILAKLRASIFNIIYIVKAKSNFLER